MELGGGGGKRACSAHMNKDLHCRTIYFAFKKFLYPPKILAPYGPLKILALVARFLASLTKLYALLTFISHNHSHIKHKMFVAPPLCKNVCPPPLPSCVREMFVPHLLCVRNVCPQGTKKLFVPQGQTKHHRMTDRRTNEALYLYRCHPSVSTLTIL